MIYSMARRYDEFPGSKRDDGSSVRGALKGDGGGAISPRLRRMFNNEPTVWRAVLTTRKGVRTSELAA